MGVSILASFHLAFKIICGIGNNSYCYVEKYTSVPPNLWTHKSWCRRLTCGGWHANNPWTWPCNAELRYNSVSVFYLENITSFWPRHEKNSEMNESWTLYTYLQLLLCDTLIILFEWCLAEADMNTSTKVKNNFFLRHYKCAIYGYKWNCIVGL